VEPTDLPLDKQLDHQRKLTTFWMERCKTLEKENEKLREKVRAFYGI